MREARLLNSIPSVIGAILRDLPGFASGTLLKTRRHAKHPSYTKKGPGRYHRQGKR